MTWHTLFGELFAGRTDRIGTDKGGSERISRGSMPAYITNHLDDDTPIGIYPVLDDNTCWWGCVDFDHGKPGAEYKTAVEAAEAANLIRRVLERLGLPAWHEVTRSNGAHIWTFANEPVPASIMRRALIVAHQIVKMPYREINPKNETNRKTDGSLSFGNYVRLPYAKTRAPGRQEVFWRGIMLDAESFTKIAHGNRTSLASYTRVAAMWKPKQPTITIRSAQPATTRTHQLRPLTRHILENGPLETADRSSTLFKLALRCRDDGLSASEAKAVLYEADERWGKFQRANNAVQLDRMVEQVYR